MATKHVVDGEAELRIRRQWDREVLPKVLADHAVYDRVRALFQEVSEGAIVGATPPGTRKRDYAEARRAWCEAYFRGLGFDVTVPKPNVSNRSWTTETAKGRVLVPRAPTNLISYEAFKVAVGEGDCWTVTNEAERAKIGWEPTDTWYWFWADAQDACPRLGTSWNDLTAKHRLLSLEEHDLLWHMVKAEFGRMLDRSFWNWLRTRFGPGALRADGYGGQVLVSRFSADGLSFSHSSGGGRAADVV